MSIRAEMFSRFADSADNFLQSGANLAKSAITQAGKEKERQEQKEQLFKSDQDVLVSLYTKELGEKLKTLPDSIDIDSYGPEMDKFSNDFVSARRNEGVYTEEALGWLENTFIPSQKAQNEASVGEVQNYVTNNWLATRANSKASQLAANPDMTVDQAYEDYKAYYESTHLANIPSGYGILLPETFREAIRGNKALQKFNEMLQDPENGYFSGKFNMATAMDQAKDWAGYKTDIIKSSQFKTDCLEAVSTLKKNVENNVKEATEQFRVSYNQYLLDPSSSVKQYDTSNIYEAINSVPLQYASDLIKLAATVESHNSDVIYNNAKTLADEGAIDEELLSTLDGQYQVTGDVKFRNLRDEIVQDEIVNKAKQKGKGDAKAIAEYILNGDFDILVSQEERATALMGFIKNLNEYKKGFGDISEWELFMGENPELASLMTGLFGTKETDSSIRFESENTENVPISYDNQPVFIGGKYNPLMTGDTTDKEAVGDTEKNAKEKPETVEPEEATSENAWKNEYSWANLSSPSNDNSDSGADLPSTFTKEGRAEAIGLKAIKDAEAFWDTNPASLTNFISVVNQHTDPAILQEMADYYFDNRLITEKDIKEYFPGWQKNENYLATVLTGNVRSFLVQNKKIKSEQYQKIENYVKDGVMKAFFSSGLSWDEFKPSVEKLGVVLASEESLNKAYSNAKSFNAAAIKADSYLETMWGNASKGAFVADYMDGKFDAFIDYKVIDDVRNVAFLHNESPDRGEALTKTEEIITAVEKLTSNGDGSYLRDYIAKQMNPAFTSYDDAVAADPSGITKLDIEVNYAVASLYLELSEFYNDVSSKLSENGVESSLQDVFIDKRMGYCFVDSYGAANNVALCLDPSTITYSEESGLSGKWYAAEIKEDENGNWYLSGKYADLSGFSAVGGKFSGQMMTINTAEPAPEAYKQQGQMPYENLSLGAGNMNAGGAYAGSQISKYILNLIARSQDNKYEKQKEAETLSFVEGYKTLFGIWE